MPATEAQRAHLDSIKEYACPDCDAVFTGTPLKAGGERIAHRKAVHGYVPPERKRKSQPTAPRKPTAVNVAKAIADEGKPKGAAAKRTPTRTEWEAKLGMVVGFATDLMVARTVNRSRVPEEEMDTWADRLGMPDEDAKTIASPVGGVIAEGPGAGLNKKFGREVMDLLDLLPAAIAIYMFNQQLRQFERQWGQPRQRRGRHAAPPAPAATPDGFYVPVINPDDHVSENGAVSYAGQPFASDGASLGDFYAAAPGADN